MAGVQVVAGDAREVIEWGRRLGKELEAGDVICLFGELGSGKTTFSQGIAAGLGVAGPVTSPTFTLIKVYQGRLPFYHADLYRLEDPAQLEDLGLEEFIYGDGVFVVEWAGRLGKYAPVDFLEVRFEYLPDPQNGRQIALLPHGRRYRELVGKLEGEARDADHRD